MSGAKAIGGAIERLANGPSNEPAAACRSEEAASWDDQWVNWDDWGPPDPGWGDVGD